MNENSNQQNTDKCTNCGESLLGNVNRCWKCGTEALALEHRTSTLTIDSVPVGFPTIEEPAVTAPHEIGNSRPKSETRNSDPNHPFFAGESANEPRDNAEGSQPQQDAMAHSSQTTDRLEPPSSSPFSTEKAPPQPFDRREHAGQSIANAAGIASIITALLAIPFSWWNGMAIFPGIFGLGLAGICLYQGNRRKLAFVAIALSLLVLWQACPIAYQGIQEYFESDW